MNREPRIEIIAEIANAHQGNIETAYQLAMAGIAADADAIKFQIYFADELLIPSHPRYQHFKNQSFSVEDWNNLLTRVKSQGACVYCDVFGEEALNVAVSAKVDGIKIHSSDLGNIPLIKKIAETGKKIFLSVGGSTAVEIATAINVVFTYGNKRPVLLYGYQSYPTQVEDSNLSRLNWLKKNFGEHCELGYMDHVAGDEEFVNSLSAMTLPYGVSVLEKHITMDRAAKGVDYYSSLNPDEFKKFVKFIRTAELAIGSSESQFTAAERKYRQDSKKYWVFRDSFAKGTLLNQSHMVSKRAIAADTDVLELSQIVGKKLKTNVESNQVILRSQLEQQVWAVIVARMESQRLPNKAILDVAGMPAIEHLIARVKQATLVDKIVLATTNKPEDDVLIKIADRQGILSYRGAVEDVLERMLGAIEGEEVDLVIRITGDDILIEPDYVDQAISYHLEHNVEYSDLKRLPSGTEVEVFDAVLLRRIYQLAKDSSGTEYLTNYVKFHGDQFKTASVPVQPKHSRNWRLTIDTEEDFKVICTLLQAMKGKGKSLNYRMDDIVEFFEENPQILEINSKRIQRQAPLNVCAELDWRRLL